ncbi:MAG: ion transporter [Thermoleophilia bacterium]|nr:ion transporter [Thermoleophilia bacterium]
MDEHRIRALARLVDSTAFETVVLAVIVANAVVLGAQTYEGAARRWGGELDLLNDVFLGVFVVELGIRIASYGRRPPDFFRVPWNLFDFVVVTAAFVPGIRESTTLLRLARLLRVVRLVRLLPELRILILAIARSLPPLFSMTVLTTLILFVYGMVGWLLFDDRDPERWGDIGRAMLTLFVMLTLENFPYYLERGMAIHPWSVVYFVSFVLVAAFIVLNVLIGVVLNSMEEARELHARDELRARGIDATDQEAAIAARLETLRNELAELERQLLLTRAPPARAGPAGGEE